MRTHAKRRWLLAVTAATCLLSGGCTPLALRKPQIPDASEDTKPKKPKKPMSEWFDSLRDDRALQVERDFQSS